MLAARSSGGGVQPPHIHRKHSVASLSGSKRNSQDKRNASAGKTQSQTRSKAALIREIETTWYLKMFGLGREEMVAHKTGMPYSDWTRMYLYKGTCPEITNPKQKGGVARGQIGLSVSGPGGGGGGGGGQGKLVRRTSAPMGRQPFAPCMLWTPSKQRCLAEVKQLEEFLNFHALSLHDTVKSRTGMVYRLYSLNHSGEERMVHLIRQFIQADEDPFSVSSV